MIENYYEFKCRTREITAPTIQEADLHNLNIFINNYPKNSENRTFLSPFYIGDSIVWATYAKGDEDPYYCLYYGGTNDLRIIKNDNGIWSNININEINNLCGFVWKMCVLTGLTNKDMTKGCLNESRSKN